MIIRAAKRLGREVAYVAFRAYCATLPRKPFAPDKVRKILVPLYAGIGNIVLYTPALRAIRRRFPHAEIVVAVGGTRSNQEVAGPAVVDRVIEIPARARFGERRRSIRALKRERFDLVVNAFHVVYPFQVAFTAFARIPWRCGHASSPGWTNPYDFLYNVPARMERDQHEIDRYLELAFALGVARDNIDDRPFIHVTPAARAVAAELLATRGVTDADTVVAVHAGTSEVMRWKQWGVERFEEAVRVAGREPGVKFVLVGAPDERSETEKTAERLAAEMDGRFVDLVGETDVPTLAAVIERASVLVGNDSGPMQIAVALDVPTVIPWGPSDLPRNRPRGPLHTVLFKGLPCSPCYRMPGDSKVHLCNDHQCLNQITVAEVVEALKARLDSPAHRV